MKIRMLALLGFVVLAGLIACGGNQQSTENDVGADYNIYDTPDMAGINSEGSMNERFNENELMWIYADLRMAIADAGIESIPGLESGRLGSDNREQGMQNAQALQSQMLINVMSTIADKYHLTKLELQELMKRGMDNMWPKTTRDLEY